MARSSTSDPLFHYLEARRRLAEWRLRRIRRRARAVAPWAAMAWLLLNVPAVVLFVVVVVKHAATSGELFRNAVAVALWAVISGIGVAVVCLTGLIALEAVGRYAAVRRKRRFHRG